MMEEKKHVIKECPLKINVNGQKKYGVLISESGINRLLSHGKNGMIIVSANRSEIASNDPKLDLSDEYNDFLENTNVHDDAETREMWLNDRNRRADAKLKEYLKNSTPYAYTATYGGYHGGDGVKDSYEPSYVVYNYDRQGHPMNFEELLKEGLKLCKMYHQDAIFVQPPDEAPMFLNSDGEKINTSSSKAVKINRDDEMFYTTNKRKKNKPQRFTSDINFENTILPVGPGSLSELRQRLSSGEYLIEDYK